MERIMITAYVSPELKARLDEAKMFFKAQTVSKLIEKVLQDSIEWMDSQKEKQ